MTDDRVILAIETSQHPRTGGVAARYRGEVHTVLLRETKRHDDDLLPAIDRLFARLVASPRQISAVGVSVGPGGFTGLRIALSTAQMFAEAIGGSQKSEVRSQKSEVGYEGLTSDLRPLTSGLLPLTSDPRPLASDGVPIRSALRMGSPLCLAVPSAMVAAESHSGSGPIMVALASKAETFWAARLVRIGDGWEFTRRGGGPGVITAEVMSLDGIRAVLADEHLPTAARNRCEEHGVPVCEPVFHPAACLAVTERMIEQGRSTDPLRLLPWYPRQPEAVTIWEQRAVR